LLIELSAVIELEQRKQRVPGACPDCKNHSSQTHAESKTVEQAVIFAVKHMKLLITYKVANPIA